MYKVDNAVILAAGTSSRFAPLSFERPKSLVEVKGEILIERQIRQLKAASVPEIYIVTGYKGKQLEYLEGKFGVKIIKNREYDVKNNNSSIKAASKIIANTYICSSDNYFPINPFENEVDESYYSALYSDGKTKEWCMYEDKEGYVSRVAVGGENAWYMMGHTFWSEEFSKEFLRILDKIYDEDETADMLWEDIYIKNLDRLKMRIRKYKNTDIFEFDSLDELRLFDTSYIDDTRSLIIKKISEELNVNENMMYRFEPLKNKSGEVIGVEFNIDEERYSYQYRTGEICIQSFDS